MYKQENTKIRHLSWIGGLLVKIAGTRVYKNNNLAIYEFKQNKFYVWNNRVFKGAK